MELVDRIISADDWVNLFVELGDIMTVFGCLSEMSSNMKVSILHRLTERRDDFDRIVSNTIEGNISLGTLPLRIKYLNMSEPDVRDIFEALFTPKIFISLMEHQGKLSTLFQSLGEFSVEYLKSVQKIDIYPTIDILFERSCSEGDILFNVHYEIRSLSIKNYDLLHSVESYLGRERFKQLFTQKASLFNLLRIAAYSTLGLELCDDIIHDEEYFGGLMHNGSGDELSSGFELDMYSAIVRRNCNFEYIVNDLISDEQWVSYFEEKCNFHAFLYILRWLRGTKIMSIGDFITSSEEHSRFFREKWHKEILAEDIDTKFTVEALEVLQRYSTSLTDLFMEIRRNARNYRLEYFSDLGD